MVTYAQLEQEAAWRQEVVTPELDWLGDELCRRLGRPRDAAGSKGDKAHLNGAHRSQAWIRNSRYCTSRTYTVQSGLTAAQMHHIAGFDMVPAGWGTARNRQLMIEQTGRLMAAMREGQLPEVREVYGTLDGRNVTGILYGSPASSDDSHLEHWHLTLDRRHLTNRKLMERIVAIVLNDPLEDDMPLTPADVELFWAKKAKEYVDEDGNELRDLRTVLDIVYATHRATVIVVPRLVEALAAQAAEPDEIRAILAELPKPATAEEIAEATVRLIGEESPADAATALVAALGPDRARALAAALTAATAPA